MRGSCAQEPLKILKNQCFSTRALAPLAAQGGTPIRPRLTPAWFTGARSYMGHGSLHMRRSRRGNACVKVRMLAWLGLVGSALALAGCASFAAGKTYASGSPSAAERADLGDDRTPGRHALSALFSLIYASGPMPALPSGPTGRLSPAEEEALIERAIAEHEMRKP